MEINGSRLCIVADFKDGTFNLALNFIQSTDLSIYHYTRNYAKPLLVAGSCVVELFPII